MPQENIEDELMLVGRSPLFNLGLRDGVRAAMEMEETIDRIITVVIDRVIDMHPEEQGEMRNLKAMISVRMTVDEGVGYIGGQRLAHERPDLLLPALDTYANASWFAMRRTRLDRAKYRSGFMSVFFDEVNGLAHPLPPEQPVAFIY